MKKTRVNFSKMYYGFPVFLISYYDENGVPNVTTLSSSYTLMDMVMLGFGKKGYGVNQIKKVKDFVINIPDRKMMQQIDFCGATSGNNTKKFDLINLTPVKSDVVNAPIIEECLVSIECSLTDVIENDEYPHITNILAKIKGRVIADSLVNEEGHLIYEELDPVLYVGDTVKRAYRYTEKGTMDYPKSFL
jgi:flavin reductase (DIM6/NTAB) family NADH-FMN oxidoreductase RutF